MKKMRPVERHRFAGHAGLPCQFLTGQQRRAAAHGLQRGYNLQ